MDGARHLPGHLDRAQQRRLVEWLQAHLEEAPWFQPTMPRWGNKLSVRMTNAGPLGWVADIHGYRYQPTHPDTGRAWPPIPAELLGLWDALGAFPQPPECCLINLYRQGARMGLHQDKDEQTFAAAVVSVSLGDTAIFRIGGTRRGDPTETLTLRSGDVVVLGGAARLAYHGIDRVLAGTSALIPGGGRVNLTLRRVTRG